jgi:hypothetical protein
VRSVTDAGEIAVKTILAPCQAGTTPGAVVRTNAPVAGTVVAVAPEIGEVESMVFVGLATEFGESTRTKAPDAKRAATGKPR